MVATSFGHKLLQSQHQPVLAPQDHLIKLL
jgi:hypothetical protein